MSDRHIRRLGQDYGTAFLSLLPQGQAWPKRPGTTLDLACRGLAEYWGTVDGIAADLLEIESDPRKTTPPQEGHPSGLLPDWERNWGLPDPCYKAPTGITERQAALIMRMTMIGSGSRDFFIGIAAQLGYTITITEYRTFVCGMDRVGDARVYGDGSNPMYNEWGNPIYDPFGNLVAHGELSEWPYYGLGPPENRFYWTVHVDDAKLTWFRCSNGQCGVDPHLRIETSTDLGCILNRWKPAHTEILFDYSAAHEPPVITLTPAPPISVAENTPIGTVIGTFDISGFYTGVPGFYLSNDAGGKFRIDHNVQLVVAGSIDYETATSHVIEVTVGDILPMLTPVTYTITVLDQDDVLPIITSPNSVSNPEDSVLAHNLTSQKAVTWAIVGGADAAKFELSGSTLRWVGNGTKDAEAPDDANHDSAYLVQVQATDSASHTVVQLITVTVVNIPEIRGIAAVMGPSGLVVISPKTSAGISRDANADGVMINLFL